VVRFLVAAEVALQLDVDAAAPEQANQPIDEPADAVPPRIDRRAADERDEPARHALEVRQHERAFTFWRAQLHARDQTTEVLVALAAFAKEGENVWLDGRDRQDGLDGTGVFPSCLPCLPCPFYLADREFRANNRTDPGRDRGFMKSRRPVDAVAVDECE